MTRIPSSFRLRANALGLALCWVLAGFGASISPVGAAAQSVQRIAAIVNDDVISVFDLQMRVRLAILSSRLEPTAETQRRLAPQVLRALIDEKLQLQEAERRNIRVQESELKSAVERIERNNGLPAGGLKEFLGQSGIPLETFNQQVRAQIAWSKLIGRRFRPVLAIGDDEVDEELERIRRSFGTTEYDLSEIFIAADTSSDEARVRALAERLSAQLAQGARFSGLAQQFSQAHAAAGGRRGWTTEASLPPELLAAIEDLPAGETTGPIRSAEGFHILRVEEKRVRGTPDPSLVTVSLRQLFFPLDDNTTPAARTAQLALAHTVRSAGGGCADVPKLRTELDSPRPAELGTFKLSDISPEIRDAVAGLDIGVFSQPVDVGGGFALLMVCNRDAPKIEPPKRAEVEARLRRERADMLSRRYLRDVRLAAVVDVRV